MAESLNGKRVLFAAGTEEDLWYLRGFVESLSDVGCVMETADWEGELARLILENAPFDALVVYDSNHALEQKINTLFRAGQAIPFVVNAQGVWGKPNFAEGIPFVNLPRMALPSDIVRELLEHFR